MVYFPLEPVARRAANWVREGRPLRDLKGMREAVRQNLQAPGYFLEKGHPDYLDNPGWQVQTLFTNHRPDFVVTSAALYRENGFSPREIIEQLTALRPELELGYGFPSGTYEVTRFTFIGQVAREAIRGIGLNEETLPEIAEAFRLAIERSGIGTDYAGDILSVATSEITEPRTLGKIIFLATAEIAEFSKRGEIFRKALKGVIRSDNERRAILSAATEGIERIDLLEFLSEATKDVDLEAANDIDLNEIVEEVEIGLDDDPSFKYGLALGKSLRGSSDFAEKLLSTSMALIENLPQCEFPFDNLKRELKSELGKVLKWAVIANNRDINYDWVEENPLNAGTGTKMVEQLANVLCLVAADRRFSMERKINILREALFGLALPISLGLGKIFNAIASKTTISDADLGRLIAGIMLEGRDGNYAFMADETAKVAALSVTNGRSLLNIIEPILRNSVFWVYQAIFLKTLLADRAPKEIAAVLVSIITRRQIAGSELYPEEMDRKQGGALKIIIEGMSSSRREEVIAAILAEIPNRPERKNGENGSLAKAAIPPAHFDKVRHLFVDPDSAMLRLKPEIGKNDIEIPGISDNEIPGHYCGTLGLLRVAYYSKEAWDFGTKRETERWKRIVTRSQEPIDHKKDCFPDLSWLWLKLLEVEGTSET